MFGTLAYTALDVGFNIILWAGVKSVTGVIYLYNYATYDNTDIKQSNMLEYNVNNNELRELKEEIIELKQLVQKSKAD